MISFKFIETCFVVSLCITLVLIMLLVYHFKERLFKTEEKVDTLFDIVQNLAKEVSNIRSEFTYMIQRPQMFTDNSSFPSSVSIRMMNHENDEDYDDVMNHQINMNVEELDKDVCLSGNLGETLEEDILDVIQMDTEDEDTDEEEDSDGEDYEEEDSEDSEDEDSDEENLPTEIIKIKIQDDEIVSPINDNYLDPTSNIMDHLSGSLNPIDIHIPEVVLVPTELVYQDTEEESYTNNQIVTEEQEQEESSNSLTSIDQKDQHTLAEEYKKMNLNILKQLVLTKGLAKDVKNLKKHELLKLLL